MNYILQYIAELTIYEWIAIVSVALLIYWAWLSRDDIDRQTGI